MSSLLKFDNIIKIENDKIELGFLESANCALFHIIDIKTGFDFIREKAAIKDLFKLEIRDLKTSEPEFVYSRDAKEVKWEKNKDTKNTSISFNFSSFSNSDLKVIIKISLDPGSSFSKWTFYIENPDTKKIIHSLTCPIIASISKVGETVEGESIVTGFNGEGHLFKDPYPIVDNLPLKMGEGPDTPMVGVGEFHHIYPGKQQMQFVLFYNDKAGLYVATHDNKQNVKTFELGQLEDHGEDPVFFISHFREQNENENISFEYDTILGVFHGDWYDGADIYKKWARQQWWCSQKLWEKDIAGWIRNGFTVFQMSNYNQVDLNLNNSLEKIADTVNSISKDLDSPILSLIFNWENGGPWTGPAGLFPPREGEDKFKNAIEKLEKEGNYGFVYIPGGTWYLHMPFTFETFDSWDAFNKKGRSSALLKNNGDIIIESWFSGWENTRMCPSTKYTRNLTSEMYMDCLRIGAAWIQIDNFPICGAAECYSNDHGHPIGYGPWWSEEWNKILKKIREESKALNPNRALSVEGISENFILYLDMYDNRTGNAEYFCHLEENLPMGDEIIPLFNYIYNEYIGSYTAAFPECNRPEILFWTRNLGKALAQGVVPTGGWYYPEPDKLNPVTIDFYKKIARATTYECWKYIMFGEMLRPPKIDVPEIDFSYLIWDDAGDLNGKISGKRHIVKDKVVQHSAWRSRDGGIGYIFVNISRDEVEFDVELSSYCSKADHYDVEMITNGKRSNWLNKASLPSRQKIRMDPLSIVVVELKTAI